MIIAMKVAKVILLILGFAALAAGAAMFFFTSMIDMKVVWEIATRYSTEKTSLVDPRQSLLVILGLAFGSGLLIGLGLGLPSKFAPSEGKLNALVEARLREQSSPEPTA